MVIHTRLLKNNFHIACKDWDLKSDKICISYNVKICMRLIGRQYSSAAPLYCRPASGSKDIWSHHCWCGQMYRVSASVPSKVFDQILPNLTKIRKVLAPKSLASAENWLIIKKKHILYKFLQDLFFKVLVDL